MYYWRNKYDPAPFSVPSSSLQRLRHAFHQLVGTPASPSPPPDSDSAAAGPGKHEAVEHEAIEREAIERLVGGPVGDLALYEHALTHRSLLRGRADSHLASNERLEFLGDAVLGFVMAEHLFAQFPNENEGYLTRLRAKLVNGQALARTAQHIGLGPLILLSDNMEGSGGRQNVTILADAFEAVIGALYLDLGLEAARAFIENAMLDPVNLASLAQRHDNYKSLLLEYAQAQGWPQPQYRVASEEGPSHDKRFTVEVLLRDTPYGIGTARSKKKAEQQAASEALERLYDEQDDDA